MTHKAFERHLSLFPRAFQGELKKKLAFKKELEADDQLAVPPRIWLAFLTPPDASVEKLLPAQLKKVWKLKAAMLESFAHPREFIKMRDPRHSSSDLVTLAVLEILFDLREHKVLLSRERYDEWLEVTNHFGLWKLRYALEDAIFKAFDPENYALFESVIDRQMFIDNHLVLSVRALLTDALERAGVASFTIENRRKNIYGVYRKVALKDKSINDIYDIHGFRILTDTPEQCQQVVATLHRLWPHFPDRYKDYITKPKQNGYQSIHTVLSCLEGKYIEFQVRTREMDVIAASGPANHAEYKRAAIAASSR